MFKRSYAVSMTPAPISAVRPSEAARAAAARVLALSADPEVAPRLGQLAVMMQLSAAGARRAENIAAGWARGLMRLATAEPVFESSEERARIYEEARGIIAALNERSTT